MVSPLHNPSQIGFVKSQKEGKNISTAIDTTFKAQDHNLFLLLSLDAEKAFDKVSWPFLTTTLRCRQFGPKFRELNTNQWPY